MASSGHKSGRDQGENVSDRAQNALASMELYAEGQSRLLESTAYEDPLISKSVFLEELWTPETTDLLIEVKKAHLDMSWPKIKEKISQLGQRKILSIKWGKILRADPEILQDLTTAPDRSRNPEEEAFPYQSQKKNLKRSREETKRLNRSKKRIAYKLRS